MVNPKTIGLFLGLFSVAGCSMFSSHSTTPVSSTRAAPTAASVAMRDSSESPDQIRNVQTRLAQDGLYGGAVDGVWGPTTSAALGRYQTAHNLDVTGRLNSQTTDSLNAPNVSADPANAPDAPGPNTPTNVAH